MEYLDTSHVLALAAGLGVPHVRDLGLIESAVQRPQMSLYGSEMYPSVASKCAALLESIVKNHPLIDGNKRLGWLSAIVFLGSNGVRLDVSDDEGFVFVVGIAAGDIGFEQIVAWFDARI